MSASAITEDVFPFVFGLHFGLHAANVLTNQALGRMGKGLQNLYSWVRFPPAPPIISLDFTLSINNFLVDETFPFVPFRSR
jgi:hypothetical protein